MKVTRQFGIIGFPLEHSYSEKYFSEKFVREKIIDCEFRPYPLKSIEDFKSLIKSIPFKGLSVTIPYKQAIIPYLDKIDDDALAVGAVNCIKFNYSSKKTVLTGYNTDVFGFETLLQNVRLPHQIKALILGTGGASLAVAYVLKNRNIEFSFVSRKPSSNKLINYKELNQEIMLEHQLIINATPVGMYPQVKKYPEILIQFITPKHICLDLIYNPSRTLFLTISEKQGARISNGLPMLYAQAERSWKIWNK
jgi:shikimate dehydrogenase